MKNALLMTIAAVALLPAAAYASSSLPAGGGANFTSQSVLALNPGFSGGGTSPNFATPPGNVGAPIQSIDNGGAGGPGSVIGLINTILFWLATLFWIAAGIFVFYAAYLYLTAGGNDDRVGKAHHVLLYAVVAIAIGIMAYGAPWLVENFLLGI